MGAMEGPSPVGDSFAEEAVPLLEKYCQRCHSGRRARAGLDLSEARATDAVLEDRATWERILETVQGRQMPPEDKRQPSEEERLRLGSAIRAALDHYDCDGPVDPGRVTIRRLNRFEYERTIQDLLGVTYRASESFPADEIGYGFDNVGDVLSMSPLLVEKYLEAAEEIVDERLPDDAPLVFVRRPRDRGDMEACAREITARFARRAYRRPLEEGELDRLLQLGRRAVLAGDTFDQAIRLILKAILVSPHFLFRVEMAPRAAATDVPRDPGDGRAPADARALEGAWALGDHALASRLSYFLWGSLPDEELMRLADEGRLNDDAVLSAQVTRMLAEPRASALVESFAVQWLQMRALDTVSPDPKAFPEFDDRLRRSMRGETLALFEHVLGENRPVSDFIDADYTFVDERLARHYGLEGVTGAELRRVPLTGTSRGGVLTHASVLTITSNPDRTSPVKRGKWILEQIIGAPPPPPPPVVEQLSEDPEAVASGSLRERFEKHREDPACAVCHDRMDPLGFAFENFDGIGAWREKDGRFPIDASGELPDGRTFDGPSELRGILRERMDGFVRSLAEKLLTYALGRGLEHYDQCAVDTIVDGAAADGYRIHSLIREVVLSVPFRWRRGGDA